jgi:hypothetical protein
MKRALETSFQELSESVPATIGIAIAPVGESSVTSFGTWSTGVAWSTIKVPLAIATLRAGSGSPKLVAKAITQSDNAAAEKLWSQLGDPAEAAKKVRAVIQDAGDTATVVESRRLRSGYTAFGQTQWSLVQQAQFAARLPCIPDASRIVNLMRKLTTDHRWGLAAKGFAAKGGWGPGIQGDYLVRQFAIVPIESGHVGVALAAEAHDGVFETGVDILNKLTDWLVRNALTEN